MLGKSITQDNDTFIYMYAQLYITHMINWYWLMVGKSDSHL